ncbi:hypothetical protein SDC9_155453 [bioreactor metagenome]|uniref:Uncharacterized protein n=1 Tax=bioreactor metagenome TaxID=1076179 RepID=A0A645F6R7_9ZZZZ
MEYAQSHLIQTDLRKLPFMMLAPVGILIFQLHKLGDGVDAVSRYAGRKPVRHGTDLVFDHQNAKIPSAYIFFHNDPVTVPGSFPKGLSDLLVVA